MMLLLSLFLAFAPPSADARVLEHIPAHYVKVKIEQNPNQPGQLSRSLVYIDGPVLLMRGTWTDPDQLENVPEPRSPVPELLAPVRVVIPGAYKLIDLESRDNVLGEVEAETYTPESRIYRVYLPISGMRHVHHYQVVFHADLKVPFDIVTTFEPPEGIVVRSRECVRQGVSFDAAVEGFQPRVDTNLVYLFCRTEGASVRTGVYAPLDRKWLRYGYGARKVFNEHGLYFALPRPARGVLVPETVTEFTLEGAGGKSVKYDLRYDPPYRPRFFTSSLSIGANYSHYTESRSTTAVDGLGFYGKLSMQAKVWPRGLDAYVGADGIISDITHSPTTKLPENYELPPIQYWALETRLGYVEPVTPIEHEWSFMGGWYFWHLYAGDGAYGFAHQLSGPEAFVQYKYQGLRRTPWWVNFRWVVLGNSGIPTDLSNFQGTLGGGFDIAWVGKRRPLSLNAELSRLQYGQNASTMELTNFVLSLSYPIY